MKKRANFLWDKTHLISLAPNLFQFWNYCEKTQQMLFFKEQEITDLLMKFYPSMGIGNLRLPTESNPNQKPVLVFQKNCFIQKLDSELLEEVLFSMLEELEEGAEIKGRLRKHSTSISGSDAIRFIPALPDKQMLTDSRNCAYRFFQNGWIEITAKGVSPLKSYREIPEGFVVWHENVIPRDYRQAENKQLLEEQLTLVLADKVNPLTGEYLKPRESKKLVKELQKKIAEFSVDTNPDTHFRDFISNLAIDNNQTLDKKSLKRLELAIGYLCHRHHIPSKRKYVLFVDKFYETKSRNNKVSEGGTGKSQIIKTLSSLMNVEELSGRGVTKSGMDLFYFSPITNSTEICFIDDCDNKFPVDSLFTRTTGEFAVRKPHQAPFTIPAELAPKIALSSNFPLEGSGNSYSRREFIVEVGNYYYIQYQENELTPFDIHGSKHFATNEWNETDWSEFYKYVFECMSKYIATDGLPSGGESDYYKRAKLIEHIGSDTLFDYLLEKIKGYGASGEEVFAQKFYREVKDSLPELYEQHTHIELYEFLKMIGKEYNLPPNQSNQYKLEKQRLSGDRWKRWISEGMGDWEDSNGNKPEKSKGRVFVFKIEPRVKVSVGANKVVPTNKRVGGSSRTGMGTTG